MLDVLIQGGIVVSPQATEQFDIGVKDGRIVCVRGRELGRHGAPRELSTRAANMSFPAASTRMYISIWR